MNATVRVNALDLMLLLRGPRARVPHIKIMLPLEGAVEVEVDCRPSERGRLFDDVLADERRAHLIEQAFKLAEGDAA